MLMQGHEQFEYGAGPPVLWSYIREFPEIKGPSIDPHIVGLKNSHKKGPPISRNSRMVQSRLLTECDGKKPSVSLTT